MCQHVKLPAIQLVVLRFATDSLTGWWSKGIDRNVEHFDRTLEQYGADLAAVCSFDAGDRPELLPYATLVSARNGDDPSLAALVGVYEWQNTPLVFLVDADRLVGDQALSLIRRRVAMRGDAPYLGILRPGQLTVHRVSLDTDRPEETRIQLDGISPNAKRATLPYLGNQRPGVAGSPRQWISNVILKLLAESIEDLKNRFGVEGDDAISVVGRALFTRFLGDRGLLPPSLILGGQDEAESLFDDAKRAANTSHWLDKNFNGDFLYLRRDFFRSLPPDAFGVLGNMLRRAPSGQLSLQWEEKWENLDFAHIPVGVLSQAYEHYLLKYAPDKRRKEGGYYTPRIIAETMVRGAFHALHREGAAHRALVLDPAAGAGVFLITAFRHLVGERWRVDQVRPDTKVLREILHQQITGFDINESALRFAALGLYLMSIELDSHPEPVEKLRFENLRGTVLYKVGEESGEALSNTLGSLGPRIDPKHVGRYDLVIGNPPWSSGTGLKDWKQVRDCVAQIARSLEFSRSRPQAAQRSTRSSICVASYGMGKTRGADCLCPTCSIAVSARRGDVRSAQLPTQRFGRDRRCQWCRTSPNQSLARGFSALLLAFCLQPGARTRSGVSVCLPAPRGIVEWSRRIAHRRQQC